MIMRKYVSMMLKHKILVPKTKQVKTHPIGQTVIGGFKNISIIFEKESAYGFVHLNFRFEQITILQRK